MQGPQKVPQTLTIVIFESAKTASLTFLPSISLAENLIDWAKIDVPSKRINAKIINKKY